MKKGCAKDLRLCFAWERSTTPFCDGSTMTGVSSILDLAVSDLSNYRALVESLQDLSLELDDAIDNFPTHQNRTMNPRYGDEQRNRVLENEEIHLSLVNELVAIQTELRERLEEVDDPADDEKVVQDFEPPPEVIVPGLGVT